MSTRKTSTKKQKSRAELRRELARDIAAILRNPETPLDLYNTVRGEVVDWSTDYCNNEAHEPDYIERCLNAFKHNEQKRTKGGAS
jgi:hypothetical protein